MATQCPSVGFFPNPDNCNKFYRCVDMWGVGSFDRVDFDCPPGTSFDSKLLYCDWPWLVECAQGGGVVDTGDIVDNIPPPPPPVDTEDIVDIAPPPPPPVDPVVTPAPWTSSSSSAFSCPAPGITGHSSDCHKFWLCKEMTEGSRVLESLLYRCPDGYLFSSATLRCAKEEDVSCEEGDNETRNLDVEFIQLTREQLPTFFQRWTGRIRL